MTVLEFLQRLLNIFGVILNTIVFFIRLILTFTSSFLHLVFAYINAVIAIIPDFLVAPFIIIIVIRVVKFVMKRGNSRNRSASSVEAQNKITEKVSKEYGG